MTTTRRSMLALLGTAPLAGMILAPTAAGAAPVASAGRIPDSLRPGGEVDRVLADRAARDEFSGTLLVTHRGRTVLSRAYGQADRVRSVPITQDTSFALASVTKLFTAVAVAQLVQQGKVAYLDRVGRFVDGLPVAVADRVTVHHLLTHTSGLGDHHMMPGFVEQAAGWSSAEAVMDGCLTFIRQQMPAFEPGARMAYSNSGYHLLGTIVARVSGRSYHDYVREHIFATAGMRGADFPSRPQRATEPRFAHPYARYGSGERADDTDRTLFVGTPAGDAYTTVADLDRFGRALLGNRLLDPALTRITLAGKLPLPVPPSPSGPPPLTFQCYGPLGGFVNGHAVVGHSGGSPGASTTVELYPDDDWSLVVLSNYGDQASGPVPQLVRVAVTS